MKFLVVLLIFSCLLITLKAKKEPKLYEVLGVLPFDSTSHFKVGETIMKSLAEFFHNVTVISPRPQKKELNFYRDISIAVGSNDFEFGNGKNFEFNLLKF